ncbi:MAG: M56 family metallopeptidase [Oscillospiraceae bacterium]|nr:M56 family metallopeptidase [Oscillospiraceae bacterium]
MKEILITSSALILALLVLRRLFRKRISRRLQYALWGLVLLRLLIPANLPAVDFSVLSVSQPARTQVEERLEEEPVYVLPVRENHWQKPIERYQPGQEIAAWSEQGHTVVSEDGMSWITYAYTLEEALVRIWHGGMAVMVLWLLASNLGFWIRLRRRRIPLELPGCKYPVYLVEEGLVSPCLFGLFRPTVYLTPAALQSPDGLRHVLAHETTHARHLDPLWSLLRSVCLTVYWFDPLVWWAAAASREDCELACDEGALKRLGEVERIPYGQTLLRLIPVRRSAGGILVTATTMTSDKKRLKERITRIAENRKMKAAALCAALTAAAAVCVVTFTGCVAQSIGPAPLTQEELDFFNEEYFNPDDMFEDGRMGRRAIRNMFLSSLYESPADIDLFELVYNGIPSMPDVEKPPRADEAAILERVYGGSWPDCGTYEITSAELDALLREYTGMPLAESKKIGLPGANGETLDHAIVYLEDYDTYYWCHGDTNYRGLVAFQSGEREGDLIRLTYDDTFYADGVKCLTLRDMGEGQYQFVSNLLVTPREPELSELDSELELTIPLADLAPYEPVPVEVLSPEPLFSNHHGEDHHEEHDSWNMVGGGSPTAGDCATFAWNYGGNTYVSSHNKFMNLFSGDYFLSFPEQPYIEEPFTDLFGYDGVVISYTQELGSNGTEIFNDYYIFNETEYGMEVHLLARAYGDPQLIDLDGDGTRELVSTDGWQLAQIFFQRDGKLYEADLVELLTEHWKRWDEETWLARSYDFRSWDPEGRYLSFSGYVPAVRDDGMETSLTALRQLMFDGTSLLLYNQGRRTADHALFSVQASYAVKEAARELAKEGLASWEGRLANGKIAPEWDDYCITSLEQVYSAELDQSGARVEVYEMAYEIHTGTPERVIQAGGTYVYDNGWVGGFYDPDFRYLVLHTQPDGSCERLKGTLPGDYWAVEDVFLVELNQILADNGLPVIGG